MGIATADSMPRREYAKPEEDGKAATPRRQQ
jgi:hypothetical protein